MSFFAPLKFFHKFRLSVFYFTVLLTYFIDLSLIDEISAGMIYLGIVSYLTCRLTLVVLSWPWIAVYMYIQLISIFFQFNIFRYLVC